MVGEEIRKARRENTRLLQAICCETSVESFDNASSGMLMKFFNIYGRVSDRRLLRIFGRIPAAVCCGDFVTG